MNGREGLTYPNCIALWQQTIRSQVMGLFTCLLASSPPPLPLSPPLSPPLLYVCRRASPAISLGKMRKAPKEFLKKFIQPLNDYYPETMFKTIVRLQLHTCSGGGG